jgi:alpha-glucosidase
MIFRMFVLMFVLLAFSSCTQNTDRLKLNSPDDKVELGIELIENKLHYRVLWHGKEMIGLSGMGIFEGAQVDVTGFKINERDSTWKTVWGQFSTIRDHYRELEIDIESKGIKGKLLARAYNQGVAFRFVLPQGQKDGKATLTCDYNINAGSNFFAPFAENEPLGPLKLDELSKKLEEIANSEKWNRKKKKTNNQGRALFLPLVVETPGQSYMALLESDLYAASGFGLMNLSIENQTFVSTNEAPLSSEELVTPWRVILLGKTAGDLVTNTLTVNLATPSKLENTDWIKPGLTLWDWRVHGYTANDGFTYGIDTESYKRFIDFAAEYGVDYFLIDDAWYSKVSKGHFELSEKLDLQAVIDYAAKKEVDLMLYYDRHRGEYGDEELFPYYQSLGIKGIKYGFMGTNVPFTRSAIQQSAKSQLLIDFHDSPVPFTGIRRTLPNAITREYCHAQQDSRRAFTPESFLKMALVNAVTGPLDMNNGNFDLTGINTGKRQKGPKKLNSYPSTVVSEAARTLVIFSGLVCIPDAPEAYRAKSDLFEFIAKQPVGKWDESKVLNSKIGEYITTARRAGKEWFVGSVYSQKGGTLDIKLDFLEEGKEYQVNYYEDTEETHCKTNPEAYRIRKGTVKKGDELKAVLAPGGGHCMWIRPV